MRPIYSSRSKAKVGTEIPNGAKIREIGGRYWVVFSPLAVRMLGLKAGQKFRAKLTKEDGVLLIPKVPLRKSR